MNGRSRWIFLTLSLATAGVCVALGLWQLRRLAARRSANAVAAQTRSAAPLTLSDTIDPAPDARVVGTGSFDLDHQFVLRGRAYEGTPGVMIATPFRIAGAERAFLVVRGFVPSDDAIAVDLAPLAEPGPRSIRGITFDIPSAPDSGAPLVRNGATTWARLDRSALARLPYPVAGVAVWQERDSGMASVPIRLGAPALTEGPHLNYAIQWFAFALIFAGGGIAYSFRKREERTQIP
ncbi:MAG TPA: SURF1 family protein [Gemmatimonadales bacterium]|nr:SURF1 family protein [Gemmatimonadales bacterium]